MSAHVTDDGSAYFGSAYDHCDQCDGPLEHAYLRVGAKIETWFSDSPDGMSTILAIDRYRGRYPDLFSHVLRVTAPRTNRGWMEVCVKASYGDRLKVSSVL